MEVIHAILTQVIIPFLAAVAIPVAVAIAHRAVSAFEDKTGLALSAQNEDKLDTAIAKGIQLAEAKAMANASKGPQLDGSKKLDMAVQFVLDEIKRHELVDVAKDKLIALIEAKLAQMKVTGTLAPAQA